MTDVFTDLDMHDVARLRGMLDPVLAADAGTKRYIDARIPVPVVEVGLDTPPGSPVVGQVWVVGTAPTGIWTGLSNHLAEYTAAGWAYNFPVESKIAVTEDRAMYIYRDGEWVRSTATYTNADAVPTTIGGITAGMSFATPKTMQEMWDLLLYPYQSPAFSSFSISGQSTLLEVGATVPQDVTFTWSSTHVANFLAVSGAIADVTNAVTLAWGLGPSGSEAVSQAGPITKTTATSHTWRVAAQNTLYQAFSADFAVTWRWRRYHGANVAATLTESDIEGLASSALASSYAGTHSFAAGGYKYICAPNQMGGQINSVKDQLTGFDVPMAFAAPYTHVDGGGFSYALVSGTNAYGVAVDYRVYRTNNVLGAAVNLLVT